MGALLIAGIALFHHAAIDLGQPLRVAMDPAEPAAGFAMAGLAPPVERDSGDNERVRIEIPNPAIPAGPTAAGLTLPPPRKPAATAVAPGMTRTVRVGNGDTLMGVLVKAGAPRQEAQGALDALTEIFDPRKLKRGQEIAVTLAPARATGEPKLLAVALELGTEKIVKVARLEGGEFNADQTLRQNRREMVALAATIDSSLYESALAAGIPMAVMAETVRAFSFDVDFQREIQRGDKIEVLFERFVNETGAVTRIGDILYMALNLSGRVSRLYRHTPKDGIWDYFDETGVSAKKALLRTPLEGAHITSRYGMRSHPIMGYTKMHRGVDFGAPTGSPIMAAGDAIVERAGRNGGYGNYVRLRHVGDYATAYAHMSRIAANIRPGQRVRQGQVIGYVGSTGNSTGPHLHYEILRGEQQVNPAIVKFPTGRKLDGKALNEFRDARAETERRFASIVAPTLVVRDE